MFRSAIHSHAFPSRPPAVKSARTKVTRDRTAPARKETGNPPEAIEDVSAVKQPVISSPRKATDKSKPVPRSSDIPPIAEAEVYFFSWDLEVDGFVSAHDDVLDAKIIERTSGDYTYWIVAACNEGDLIMHKIASDMNPRWSQQTHSLTWNYNLGGTYGSWAFQFTSPEEYKSFKAAFTRAAWETLHRIPFTKIKVS